MGDDKKVTSLPLSGEVMARRARANSPPRGMIRAMAIMSADVPVHHRSITAYMNPEQILWACQNGMLEVFQHHHWRLTEFARITMEAFFEDGNIDT